MMTEEQIDKIVERLISRIEQANIEYLKAIGESIKKISKLKPTEAHKLVQILKYGGNYNDIKRKLAKYTKLNIKDIDDIFKEYAKMDLDFYEQFYKYRNIPFIEYEYKEAYKRQVESLANIVKKEMYNFTRDNVLGYTITDTNGRVLFKGLRDVYNDVLDKALLNVGQGKDTFDSAMKNILKELGGSGLKTIQYESGRAIRLDSAVRMHLKGRIRELHNENQKIIGEELQTDGIEISVHGNPAPDHAPVQGRQFSTIRENNKPSEWEKLQAGEIATDYQGIKHTLDHDGKNGYRPISELNCYHVVFTVILGINKPLYTNEELQKIIDDNEKGFEYEGKHYTNYEGTQIQRMLERKIRQQKDIQILAKESGNEFLAGESQNKITVLTRKYKEFTNASNLQPKAKRMQVSSYNRSKEATKIYEAELNKYKVGELDINKYTKEFKPTTKDILLTPKQHKHILGYEDRQKAIKEIPNIIKNPDHIYIEKGKKNTIWLTKKIDGTYSHKLVIKLNTTTLYQEKELGYKHSVITMHPLKTERLNKYNGKRIIQID